MNDYDGELIGRIQGKAYFRLGIEAEFILPFDKGNWTIMAEPSIQKYQTDGSPDKKWNVDVVKVDYTYVDVQTGLRRYFNLNERSRVFINASMVSSFRLHPSYVALDYSSGRRVISMENAYSGAFGAGFSHHRLSAELRVFTNRNITGMKDSYRSNFKNASFILGYRIL